MKLKDKIKYLETLRLHSDNWSHELDIVLELLKKAELLLMTPGNHAVAEAYENVADIVYHTLNGSKRG